MIKARLTQKALDALALGSRCDDFLRHEFVCPHRGRMHGLNWQTKDGCSNDVCLGCYYADGGPAHWDDLKMVRAVHERELNFLRIVFDFNLPDSYLDVGECVICGRRHPGFRSKCTL